MRIGILGAGRVGSTLAQSWTGLGHEVMYGVRDPAARRDELTAAVPGVQVGTLAEAAAFGEVVALTTTWQGAGEAIAAAGDLTGKVLLDATNPLSADMRGLADDVATSGAEQIAAWATGARVVKIFNTTGVANMAAPVYGGQSATMFYCGDDADAKQVAASLAQAMGFDPVDAGALSEARTLEHLALLWVRLAYIQRNGPGIAFKLLRR